MKRNIVITGESGAGKSSVVQIARALRDSAPALAQTVAFPIRYSTRAPRTAEDTEETRIVSHIEFRRLIAIGHIDIWWSRGLRDAWAEPNLYGFARADEASKIYSANSAFFSMPTTRLKPILDHATVIYVTAQKAAKLQRLSDRSPEMALSELNARLAESGSLALSRADYIIDNTAHGFSALTLHAVSILKLVCGRHLTLTPDQTLQTIARAA